MPEVFIIGDSDEENKCFRNQVQKCLQSIITSNYPEAPQEDKYRVVFTVPEIINSPKPILIIRSSQPNLPQYPTDTVIFINSNCRIILKQASQIITLGYGQKDTISISSINEDNAVLSVLRPIKTIKNNLVGPLDMPVKLVDNQLIDELIFLKALELILTI